MGQLANPVCIRLASFGISSFGSRCLLFFFGGGVFKQGEVREKERRERRRGIQRETLVKLSVSFSLKYTECQGVIFQGMCAESWPSSPERPSHVYKLETFRPYSSIPGREKI